MTKYNEIFKLHIAGYSNTAIEKYVGCSRKTVITVLQLAKQIGFVYREDTMTDSDIHKILHPSKSISRGYQEISREKCIIQKVLGISGNNIWRNYSIEAREQGKKPFSQTYFKQFLKELPLINDFPEYIGAEWWLGLIKNNDDKKINILWCMDLFSGSTYCKNISNLTARSWIDVNNELFSMMQCVPERVKFIHRLPAFLTTSTELMLQYYGVQNCGVLQAQKRKELEEEIKSILKSDKPIVYLMEICRNNNHTKWCSSLNSTREEVFRIARSIYPSLPGQEYDYCETKYTTALINFHVEVDSNYYSIPFEMRKERFKVVVSKEYVEIHCNNCIVCVHDRIRNEKYRYKTEIEHMPSDDTRIPYKELSGTVFRKWAQKYGTNVSTVISIFLKRGLVEAQGYLSCMAVMSKAKNYADIIDYACKQILEKHVKEWFTARDILNYCEQLKEVEHA